MEKKRKRKIKLKKQVYYFIIVILVIGFVVTSYKFISMSLDDYQNEKEINDLQESVEKDILIEDDSEDEVYTVDFDKLKEINPDTIAWIEIEGTSINYAVVQTTDNNYYLSHSFDKSSNRNGWIFLNYKNDSNFQDYNSVIFAHKSMFKYLTELYDANSSDDIYIKLYQEDSISTYQVFALYVTKPVDVSILVKKYDEELIESIISKSKYDYDVEVSEEDYILTLSSCYKSASNRIIMHAKKID